MQKVSLDWLAGFYEGEGYAGFVVRKERSRNGLKIYRKGMLYCGISQANQNIICRVQRYIGSGFVVETKNKGYWKLVYHWRATHKTARLFLRRILPFLRTKHKITQIKRALKKDTEFYKGD